MPPIETSQQSVVSILRQRISAAWHALRGRENAFDETTSGRGSLVSDPYADLYNRRYNEPIERDRLVEELETLYVDHPVLKAAMSEFINGALSDFRVNATAAVFGEVELARAKRIFERTEDNCQLKDVTRQVGWDAAGFGDCFAQPSINVQREISRILIMPVKGMIRNTNLRDEFHEPERAFIQRFITGASAGTGNAVYFCEGEIIHTRHDNRQGERYGTALPFAGRSVSKDSIAALRSLFPRRQANMPFRVFKVNAKGVTWKIFRDIMMNKLSRLFHIKRGGETSPFDDVFVKETDVDVKGGDPELGKLEDIELLLDCMLALIGTSRQMLGFGASSGARDLLDEQTERLYDKGRRLQRLITNQFLRPLFDLALSLQGIPPAHITYTIDFARQYTDSRAERRIENSRLDWQQGLIRLNTAVRVRADYYGIENVDEEVAAIIAENPQRQSLLPKRQESGAGAVQPETLPGLPGEDKGQTPPIKGLPGKLLALPNQAQLKDQRVQRILQWNGLSIGIEYERGDKRFNRPMASIYGHIRGTYGMGGDGESIDVYLLPGSEKPNVYKITQLSADGEFDEYKYMLGWNDPAAARAAYIHQMPQQFYGGISEASIDELRPQNKTFTAS